MENNMNQMLPESSEYIVSETQEIPETRSSKRSHKGKKKAAEPSRRSESRFLGQRRRKSRCVEFGSKFPKIEKRRTSKIKDILDQNTGFVLQASGYRPSDSRYDIRTLG